jgi:Tol biopolymer transport system component
LTADDTVNSNPQWSPDGAWLLYQASLPGSQFRLCPGLRLVAADGKTQRDLVWEWGAATSASWHPDGRRVVFVGQPAGQHLGTKSDLYVIDVDGAAPPDNRRP